LALNHFTTTSIRFALAMAQRRAAITGAAKPAVSCDR